MREHQWEGSGLRWHCTCCGTAVTSTVRPEMDGDKLRIGMGTSVNEQVVTSRYITPPLHILVDCDQERVRLFNKPGRGAWGHKTVGAA